MENMKLKPLGNRILGQRVKEEESIANGILLPDSLKNRKDRIKVLDIGTGEMDVNGNIIPIQVKIGDIIFTEKYCATEIPIGSEEYLIIKYSEVIAVLVE